MESLLILGNRQTHPKITMHSGDRKGQTGKMQADLAFHSETYTESR